MNENRYTFKTSYFFNFKDTATIGSDLVTVRQSGINQNIPIKNINSIQLRKELRGLWTLATVFLFMCCYELIFCEWNIEKLLIFLLLPLGIYMWKRRHKVILSIKTLAGPTYSIRAVGGEFQNLNTFREILEEKMVSIR